MASSLQGVPVRLLLVAAAGCALAACGGPSVSVRVSPKVVQQFPPEARSWVYDAENEVIIALDNRDAVKAKIAEIDKDIDRAKAGVAAAKKRGGKGEGPAQARVAWYEARREHAEALLDAADVAIICARASLELSKAKLVVRFDVLGDDRKFSVKAFERQHENCARELLELNRKADKMRDRVKKAEGDWRKARADFVRASGDHDHGLWID
jgi:hypothetical protein